MRHHLFALLVAAAAVALSGTYAAQTIMQPAFAPSAVELPPVGWTCPMHPDVMEEKAGACPICKMDLEAVRLVTVWKCPVHGVIEEQEPGKCRICTRDLIPNTMALTFTCTGHPEINQLEPGECENGKPMVRKYTARSHGDHNPKHGGVFFMASDTWHHIEGTYPAAGRLRVYLYDDFTKPLPAAQARGVKGRIVTKEVFNPATKTTRELASAPLVLVASGTASGSYLEAKIEPMTLPAQITAKIAFKPGDKENRFDFTFAALSKDTATPAAAPRAAPGPIAPAPSAAVSSLLSDLKASQAELGTMVETGQFASIYVPALRAKDIALEIGVRAANIQAAEGPVKQIVLAAFQLDNFGDLGDREQIDEALSRMNAAIAALEKQIAGRP